MIVRRADPANPPPDAAVVLAVALPAMAWAQPAPAASGEPPIVEVDPIRCWWRTSTGAVRTGAPFSLDLTCAVLENDAVRVVPDESRLGGNVMQMAPFEIVDSAHPSDLYSGQRRFFQYHYSLRIISPDAIGKDVHIPDLAIQYRVNSRLAGECRSPGPRSRVFAAAPVDPRPLDGTGRRSRRPRRVRRAFRRSRIARVSRTRPRDRRAHAGRARRRSWCSSRSSAWRAALDGTKPVGERVMSGRRLVRLAADELSAVQRETERLGWDAARIERALAASRVAAAIAMGRRVSQSAADSNAEPGEGRLVAHGAARAGRRRTSGCRAPSRPKISRGKTPGPGRPGIRRRGRRSSTCRGRWPPLAASSTARTP